MAFKSLLNNGGKIMKGLGGEASATRQTTIRSQKTRAYSAASPGAIHHENQGKASKYLRGDFVPVYVAVGMIMLSLTFGVHTAKQQLMHSPTVFVKKSRRETLPEVVEPEHVVEEAEKFFKKSFFRKVAHVQKFDKAITNDPIRADAYAHRPHVETLKSVGVDPIPH